ncbi:MAG: hypothetical protein SH820_03270 [Xanthomonadales bacterium]|nr:hypothetical protein [Xanthomonadales bacterium]
MTDSLDIKSLTSPDWLLAGFDAEKDRYHLAKVSRETYRASSFLDHRIQPLPTETLSITGQQLDKVLQHVSGPPASWIFHTGFCCSTLLASCLDHPGSTLVLREPKVLSLLAHAARKNTVSSSFVQQRVIGMCERSYPGEALVIKPSNFANSLMGGLMFAEHHERQRKTVLMSSSLESLLISILKKRAEAEASLPAFLNALLQDSDYLQVTGISNPGQLHLLQQSVLFWHCQRRFLQQRLAEAAEGSFMSLSMERFLAQPQAVLAETSEFFNLGLAQKLIQETVETGAFGRHSKQTGKDYNPETHRMEQAATKALFATEIEQAMNWAEPLLEQLPIKPFDKFEASN